MSVCRTTAGGCFKENEQKYMLKVRTFPKNNHYVCIAFLLTPFSFPFLPPFFPIPLSHHYPISPPPPPPPPFSCYPLSLILSHHSFPPLFHLTSLSPTPHPISPYPLSPPPITTPSPSHPTVLALSPPTLISPPLLLFPLSLSLLQSQDLPSNWGASMTPTGRIYYINHNTQTTTWEKPRYKEVKATPGPSAAPVEQVHNT